MKIRILLTVIVIVSLTAIFSFIPTFGGGDFKNMSEARQKGCRKNLGIHAVPITTEEEAASFEGKKHTNILCVYSVFIKEMN
jgi:hypothetical protein